MASRAKRRKPEPEDEPEARPEGPQTDEEQIDEDKTNAGSPDEPPYAPSYLRVSKDNLYMIIALCMQERPVTTDEIGTVSEPCKKVGAVLVLPNDVIFAADCSRDGVHAVARLLMKHYDKVEGCKIFVSRKPCPFCAKLLVQSKVKRVLYLPSEPEYYSLPEADSMMKQVDNLFTASAIAQTRFVLDIEKPVLADAEKKTPSTSKSEGKKQIEDEKRRLSTLYDFDEVWMESVKEKLPWPAFDKEIKAEVLVYFDNAMEWMARVNVLSGKGLNYKFERYSQQSRDSKGFDPANDNEEQARHFMTIARYLAERTDDPRIGVGAVIVSPKMEVLAFGWNGFPFKAYYAEFARASKKNLLAVDKKGPYVIHAEQNAILLRNSKNLEGAILFVTKSPCNECAPLIAMQGIETVVVDDNVNAKLKEPRYDKFPKMVERGKFVCYQTTADLKTEAKKNLNSEFEILKT